MRLTYRLSDPAAANSSHFRLHRVSTNLHHDSSLAAAALTPASQAPAAARAARWKFVLLWLVIGAIAAGACALKWPSAHFGAEPLPYTIDSFYHARRILDTVADPAAFY